MILILGKVPPPIGGVTIHVSRLLKKLLRTNILFNFMALNIRSLMILPFKIYRITAIHLHTSNIYIQAYVVILCYIFRKVSIITFHGDLNRYSEKKLRIIKWVIKRANVPIVLNESSFKIALTLNIRTRIISSFIAPEECSPLEDDIMKAIDKLRERSKFIFATNAYGLTYDKFNNEIYGIIPLIDYFSKHLEYGLVISDPSGQYLKYIQANQVEITDNIFIIPFQHSFFEILKVVDASIRNTSTDGDSLSVKESIYLKKITYATDVVSRPSGAELIERDNFTKLLEIGDKIKANHKENDSNIDGSELLFKVYKEILD